MRTIQDKSKELVFLYNNTPYENFEGLTTNQLETLITNPLSKSSPVQLCKGISNEILAKVPYLKLTEEFLKIIEESGNLRLTTTKALPLKTIERLRILKLIKEPGADYFEGKKMRERNSDLFTTLNITTRFLPFIKCKKNELTFTHSGIKWLEVKDRNILFAKLLQVFTSRFNWAYNDGYPLLPVGQFGWAYTIFLLLKYGKKKFPIKFYSDLYLKAFPSFLDDYPEEDYWSPEIGCHNAYSIRAINRFVEWFGLGIVSDYEFDLLKQDGNLQRTDIFPEIFFLNNEIQPQLEL